MKKIITSCLLFLLGITMAYSATYSNIVSHIIANNGNGSSTITFIVCSNTSFGEGIAIEANYNTSTFQKSVANLTFISSGQSCTGGSGTYFSVQITLSSSLTNIKFQSFATNTFGDENSSIPNTFSGFNYTIGVLPVQFKSFELSRLPNAIQLDWQTYSETNHSHYEVQRSGDAINWTSIGRVKSDLSRSPQKSYEYTDLTPLTGRNYYRIQQVDLDGTTSYSEVRSIQTNLEENRLLVFPNPSPDKLIKVEYSNKNQVIAQVAVYNQLGQSVYQQNINSNSIDQTINLQSLASGLYLLSLNDASGKVVEMQKVKLE